MPLGLYTLYAGLRRLLGLPVMPPGIRVGKDVWIGRGVELDWSHGHAITLGDRVTIAQGARLLCHDASSFRRLGVTWVAPIDIADGAFVGADALVLPGVTIGRDAVVAAGAVVAGDVAPGTIVGGVPARQIGTVEDLDRERGELLAQHGCLDDGAYAWGRATPARRAELLDALAAGGLFLGGDEVARRYPRRSR